MAQLRRGAPSSGVADGKEPLVWLDKACIDQDNVDANLAALRLPLGLPLARRPRRPHLRRAFGASSKSLLSCAWAARPVDLVYRLSLDSKLSKTLGKFDALKAKCYSRDREKLLMIVEAGFGDVRPFNKQVRHILDANVEATSAALPMAAAGGGECEQQAAAALGVQARARRARRQRHDQAV